MLKAAIVGFGKIAHGHSPEGLLPLSHLGAYITLNDRVKVVAVCDTNKANQILATEMINNVRIYSNFENMLHSEDIDILSISSPDEFHYEQIKQLPGTNVKGVWCEKPIVTDKKQLRELKELIPSLPVFQVNYWRRFVPEIQALKERINSNEFGKVNRVVGYYPDGWLRNGSHLLDLINFIIGKPSIHTVLKDGDVNSQQLLVSGWCSKDTLWSAIPVPRDRYNIFELDILLQYARIRVIENGRSIEIIKDKKDNEFQNLHILSSEAKNITCNWKTSFIFALSDLLDCVEGEVSETVSPLLSSYHTAETMINL